MMELKKKIRQRILDIRNNMSAADVETRSEIIIHKLMELDAFKRSGYIMSYVNFGNEVATKELIRCCLSKGVRVAVPIVRKTGEIGSIIVPSEIFDIEKELKPGVFGILEPDKNFIRPVNVRMLDMIVVPGIGFDNKKNRIGFGAGYYDRFLTTIPESCLKVGLAFETQIIDEIPVESHDVPLDMVITEKRLIC